MNRSKFSLIVVLLLLMVFYSCNSNNKKTEGHDSEVTSSTENKGQTMAADSALIHTIDFGNIQESKLEIGEFPFVSDLPEFEGNKTATNETKDTDFDKLFFYDGKGFVPFEGKLHYRKRLVKDGESFSAYKVQKSFEEKFEKMGAVKIFSGNARDHFNDIYDQIPQECHDRCTSVGNESTVLYALKKGNAHFLLYLSVDANYNGYYEYYAMQLGEFKQN